MTNPNDLIVSHYTKGALFDRIMEGLKAAGKDPDALSPEDLKPVDEFHIGGLQATSDLLKQVDIGPGSKVLDIGAGIGGAARHMAASHGAQITGVDLTPEFVETARRLSSLTGLPCEFQVGNALELPAEDEAFDVATLLHVGMNIQDKPELFAEAARVLKPGGVFAVYDIMLTGSGQPQLPVPWASSPECSFLAPPETYRTAAANAGFAQIAERARAAFALEFFAKLTASIAKSGPPPVGLGLIMGPDAPTKIANMVKAIDEGHIAPVEMLFRKLPAC